MARASLLSPRYEHMQREGCPNNVGFFHCGDIATCCAVDPCDFLAFPDPCSAAIAINDDNNGNGDGEGEGDGEGDGDGDGDGDSDGGDGELTLRPSSTKVTQTTSTTHKSETSSTSEIGTTSSSASLPSTSSVETSSVLVTNTITFATGVSSTSPAGASAAETTLPTSSDSNDDDGTASPPLSNTTIAGVGVGAAVGGIALLLLLFWLLRRRRLSKRMSSLRGDSPGPARRSDKKSIMDCRDSLTGTALGAESLPALGGPAPSPKQRSDYVYNDQPLTRGTRRDEGWPLCTASDPNLYQQQFSTSSPQLDPRPAYAELDSSETEFGPTTGTQSPKRRPSPQIHPSQLTPGFPGTQMAIQNRGRSWSTGINRDYHHASSANTSVEAAPLRATLNATHEERMNNLYANSWARGL
ncbi:hypothetical protein F4803DRAFT_574850 [Xylaria telfairii]|nr:hypothetical protein F4803DRAFT_574850 [Xylaria telfairii]